MMSTLLWSLFCLTYIVSGQNKTQKKDSNKTKRHLLEFPGLVAAFGFNEPPKEDSNQGARTVLNTAIAAAFKKLDKNTNNLNLVGFQTTIRNSFYNEMNLVASRPNYLHWDGFVKLTNKAPITKASRKRWFDYIKVRAVRDAFVNFSELADWA